MKKHTVRLGRLLACIMMPLVMGACMSSHQRNLAKSPFADVTNVSDYKNSRDAEDPKDSEVVKGVGKALLGGAALVILLYGSLDFSEIGDAMARSISR